MSGKLFISRAALHKKPEPKQKQIINNIMQYIEELKQEILKRNQELTAKQTLEFALLDDALKMYNEASENIEEHGITMSFNSGKTFGLNPCIKVKNDATKMIMRILKSLFAKVDDNEDDEEGFDFIESLKRPTPLYQ